MGERGLQGALCRVAADSNAVGAVELAATEGIWWCAALEDWHVSRLGWPRYGRLRDAHGRVVGGLVFARNLAAHQLTIVPGFVDIGEPLVPFRLVVDEESGEEASVGVQLVEIRWLPRASLPAPTKPEMRGRDVMYDAEVAGRTLEETLAAALRFFREDVWRD